MRNKLTSITILASVLLCVNVQSVFSQEVIKNSQNLELRLHELETKFENLSKKTEALNSSKVISVLNEAQVFGRLQVDANWYDEAQDTDNKSDGIDIARARLGIRGKISENLSYKFENDFSENASEIKDAFIAYNGFENSTITIGQSKPTFSLEILESSNHMAFIQRAVVSDDAVLTRRVGVKADKRGKEWRVAAGIFGESVGNEARSDDSKYSFTARASIAPINNDESLLHIGAATSFTSRDRNIDDNTDDTLDKERLIGGELIARHKAFTLQAEYILNDTKYDGNTGAGNDVSFPGYYIQTSVFLTGEQREYSMKSAKLGKITVKRSVDNGGIGAVELAARISYLNRNDNLIFEGETNNYTLGVNWYPNDSVRVMLNYLKSETEYAGTKSSEGHDAVSIRTRIYF
jgi:phosphate-selective porin OprO/OprP